MAILTILTLVLVSFAGIIPNKITPVWYPQLIMLSVCLFLYVNYALWKFNKWLSMFLGYVLFSVLSADLFFALYNGIFPNLKSKFIYALLSFGKINLRSLIMLYHVYLCVYVSYRISFINKKQRKWILKVILAIVFTNILWAILQYFNIDPLFHGIDNSKLDYVVGFMGSWNCLGSYLAICSPLVLWFSSFLILPLALTIIAAKMWYGIVIISILSISYLITFEKRLLKYFIPVFLIMFIFTFLKYDESKLSGAYQRARLWKTSISAVNRGYINITNKTIKCSSLIGYGFGNFPSMMPYYEDKSFNTISSTYNHAHNDIIEAWFELGHLGLALLLLLFYSVIKRFVNTVKTKEFMVVSLCLLSYFLCSNGYFTSHMPATGMMLIVFYGMFEGIRRENGTITKNL